MIFAQHIVSIDKFDEKEKEEEVETNGKNSVLNEHTSRKQHFFTSDIYFRNKLSPVQANFAIMTMVQIPR